MEELIAPLMFVIVFFLIFSGYPVAFSLAGVALVFAIIGVLIDVLDVGFFTFFPLRVFNIMSNQVLLAIPFFILMGTILEKSKIAEDLLTTMGALFGRIRGGLALAVIFVGALLAAATGVVGASVVAMGMISMPVMLRYGYSKALTAGVISASGTLGQIIPPSVVLVVLADQMEVTVGDLFMGALIPGISLAGLYALYVLGVAIFVPSAAPALPKEAREIEGSSLVLRIFQALIPPLILIILVLGSIFAGIATPTEAGSLGALGALGLATIKRRLSWKKLSESLDETVHLTVMVMFLLVGSTAFSLVFRGFGGDDWIRELLVGLPGGEIGLILIANLVIFILGFFIDFFEIAFILLPLLVPAAKVLLDQDAGHDMVWFAVLIAMNLQTSFLTPPFGFSLFYLRGVAPEEVKTQQIYRGVLPFIVIQILAIIAVYLFPELVHFLIPKVNSPG